VKLLHSYNDEDTIIVVDEREGPRAIAILEKEITFANKRVRMHPGSMKVNRSEVLPLAKKNVCAEHHCIKCCNDTEKMLLGEDVTRIKELGFAEGFFTL
jgi:hypothetical protein